MRAHRGFTLIELAVTVAMIAILATLAYGVLIRQRPRANLLGATTELFALVRNARQNALATGRNTVVLVFPDQANSEGGTGRVVLVEDPGATMFGATSPNFTSFSASRSFGNESLLGDIPFPKGVTVGFGGAAPPTLAAPYATVPSNVPCTFCSGSGDHRGAIVFDYRGRARFYNATGAALAVSGGSIALQGGIEFPGYRMLVVHGATGSAFTTDGT